MGLACQSLVNEISAGEMRKARNKSKLMPVPRDTPFPYRAARSHPERAAPSARVGRRFSAPQTVWNKSNRCAGERGGARVARSAASRMLRTMREGIPVCVTVTLLDGLVLARSAFHHSMNYRSVMILGTAVEVTDQTEKYEALKAVVEHVVPQRWADVRWPTEQELRATIVLRLPIEEVSAKIRTGPPLDEEEDCQLPCWAGEIPLRLVPQIPIPDPRLDSATPLPQYVQSYYRPPWRST
jgi:nitroimidazol reductase NimA-like FMN-containing flavoprotein (pyridoxamine 5'-phosphate oxidase superfamily)